MYISSLQCLSVYDVSPETGPSLLGPNVTASLISGCVISRLDYCNAILAGLLKSTIARLQCVPNAAVRLVAGLGPRDIVSAPLASCSTMAYILLGPRDHVTSALCQLHWLPVQQWLTYKLCPLMHLVHTGHALSYLVDSVTATQDLGSRLRLLCEQSSV